MNYRIVVIGASLGGLHALRSILSSLTANFSLPVVIVQHRCSDTHERLQFLMQRETMHHVKIAEDKEAIIPGTIYLAPSDYHLLIEDDHFVLSIESPVNYAMPSIDLLFESAADSFGSQAIGIVLTGTGNDGAHGLKEIENHGGLALIEFEETAYAKEMPEAAAAATKHPTKLKLEEIGPYLVQLERVVH